jgi:hypothetical protein
MKSHTTHTNTHTNDFKNIPSTENVPMQMVYEKLHTSSEISTSFPQIGENFGLRNFSNLELCSTMPTNVCTIHSNSRHSKKNDTPSLLE